MLTSLAGGISAASAQIPDPEPRYFLVAETSPFHGDSYVLPLSDSLDVAHAREILLQGPGAGLAAIVTAEIAAGSDGVNRNVLAPGEPPWSWHVTGFLGFADLAAEVCDGWPSFVEQDVEGWIDNTGGIVCFWSYTVVAELDPVGAERSTWGRIKARYEGTGRLPPRGGPPSPP